MYPAWRGQRNRRHHRYDRIRIGIGTRVHVDERDEARGFEFSDYGRVELSPRRRSQQTDTACRTQSRNLWHGRARGGCCGRFGCARGFDAGWCNECCPRDADVEGRQREDARGQLHTVAACCWEEGVKRKRGRFRRPLFLWIETFL